MDLELDGKRALVTGGTRGIGLAIVKRLAAEGCAVATCARSGAVVDEVVGALRDDGATAMGTSVDVSDASAIEGFTAQVVEAWGGIDVLVCNVSALAMPSGPASWRTGLEVDILGTVHTVEAALPTLAESPAPSIVVVSSTAAQEIYAGERPYNGIKAALNAYVGGLSQDIADRRIRANIVSPGTIYFESGVWGQIKREKPEYYEKVLARNPLGRLGTPQDIADAVAFLSSARASFITGANIVVDGGFTRRIY